MRQARRSCLILERQELPKFKLCAGWITPKVVADLEIDVSCYPYGILPLDRIRLYLGASALSVSFPTRQYSIRRAEFDNWLLERSGAEIARHAVRAITRSGEFYVIDGEFRCRYLVGAGGTNCPVRRAFFPQDNGGLLLTQEIEYDAEPKDRTCTLFYPFAGWAGYGWHLPKADGVNIGFGAVASQFHERPGAYWEGFVELLIKRGLIDSLPPAPMAYPYRFGDRFKALAQRTVFIVGDAAGLATTDMGEGIGPAVESGILAAKQILGLETYTIDKISKRTMPGLPGWFMERAAALACDAASGR